MPAHFARSSFRVRRGHASPNSLHQQPFEIPAAMLCELGEREKGGGRREEGRGEEGKREEGKRMRRDAEPRSVQSPSLRALEGPCANHRLGFLSFASSTSFASHFYPSLVSSRSRRNSLKTNGGGASYASLEPWVDRHKNEGSKSRTGCTLAAVLGRRVSVESTSSGEGGMI